MLKLCSVWSCVHLVKVGRTAISQLQADFAPLYKVGYFCTTSADVKVDVVKPQDLLKKDKKPVANYIFDKEICECIVKKVCERLPHKAVVLECNPGIGMMTPGFLRSGNVSKVLIAEAKEEFLQDLEKKYTCKRRVKKSKLYTEKLNFFAAKRPEEKEDLHRLLDNVEMKAWDDDPPLSIVGILPAVLESPFMTKLLHWLASRDSIFSVGRTELYLFLTAQHFRNVGLSFPTCDNRVHHQSSILYSLLFNISCLMQVDKSLFSPPIPRSRRKLVIHPLETTTDTLDPDMMYLVHLQPKKNLSDEVMEWEQLPKFIVFLRQMTRVRKVRLIPRMESWVPGCGVHLILMNYTMMTYIHDLIPTQYVDIYKAMLAWPEYQESSLQLLLEKEVAILHEDESTEAAGDTAESNVP